ncbi:hypothetical protein D9M71_497090 [compost metagenome]
MKFALFGMLPVVFSADGSWEPVARSAPVRWLVNKLATAFLQAVVGMERVFGVQLDVPLVPLNDKARRWMETRWFS